MYKKQFDDKDKSNFKTNDVTTQLINNYNIGIAQYITKKRQPNSKT